ncbi:MAG: glycosyltransferase [Planctomycetes bacterium]|nr:glycosyltransferase [Planctomycetota bacterium]
MAVISTTLCYPTPVSPTQGVFVQRRLAEIGKLTPLHVVVPMPWFPLLAPMRTELGEAAGITPPTWYQRMVYVPGVLKSLDARWYERSLLAGIDALKSAGRIKSVRLIDAHFEWPDGVGAFRAARRLNVPFVCTLRGKLVSQIEHSSKRTQIREMLLGADALISVSKSLAGLAREVAGKELAISVIPNAVDTAFFHPCDDREAIRKELGWPQNSRIVVSIGHLQELKGFHHLIELWPTVRKQAGDARLVLIGGAAGEPAYERRLRERIAELEMVECITLAGRQTPAQIAKHLGAADLFTLASRSEGWCNALAEALACGCPAVVTDVGGNEEVMNEWGLGRLVPYGNWEAFAERVAWALEEPWDRAKIAEFGGRRTWQQTAEECVGVFDRVRV